MTINIVTVANMLDSGNVCNQIGVVGSGGEVFRDRPLQTCTVRVDLGGELFVDYTSKEYQGVWLKGNAQLGNFDHADSVLDRLQPVPILTAA